MAKTITRQTLNLFGATGASTNFAEFGSQAASAPVKTKAIATIQALAAYADGWQSAVALGNAPYLEDMNALFYLQSYQQCYMLQEGTPEWDTGTIYFIGSLVKRTGTSEIYMSLTDSNSGNALPSAGLSNTNWQFVSGIIGGQFVVGGSAQLPWNAAGYLKGTVVQTVQVIDTVASSTSGTTFAITTTAASITPKATTHKIRVTITGSLQSGTWTAPIVSSSIFRGSTDLSVSGNGFGIIINTVVTQNAIIPCSMAILDSPASVGALTYSCKIKCGAAGGTALWNNNGANAIILLEEIAF